MSSKTLPVAEVPWLEQFRLLGVVVPCRALPTIVACPLCLAERLSVYTGRSSQGGPLLDCRSCRFQGTLLELSAKLWKLSIAETCSRFTALGVPLLPPKHTDEDLDKVERAYDEVRKIRTLWTKACRNATNGKLGTVGKALDRYECGPSAAAGPRYFRTVAHMFGVIAHKEAEEAIQAKKRRTRNRLFVGPGWKDVVVLPRFSRPGEICALEFVGRKAELADYVIAPTNNESHELGLFGLETALNDTPFGSRVLVTDHALTNLRLQKRHLCNSSVPLPIVSWLDSGYRRTLDTWQLLPDRTLVFWINNPTTRLVRQVMLAGPERVRICNMQPPEQSREAISLFLRRIGSGLDAFNMFARNSATFEDYLSRWVCTASDNELETFVRGLLRNNIQICDLHDYLRAAARSRINKIGISSAIENTRTVTVKDQEIVEARGGWYVMVRRDGEFVPKGSRLISSVVLRLLSLKNKTYKAELISGDTSRLVELPAGTSFDREVQNLCVQFGLDVTIDLPRGLSLASIALAFSGDVIHQT